MALRYAARVNGFSGLALTRLDVLSGLEEIRLCVGYRLPDGTVTEHYPADADLLGRVEAVYETLPGWQGEISTARRLKSYPGQHASTARG